jgi:hypothetical protein
LKIIELGYGLEKSSQEETWLGKDGPGEKLMLFHSFSEAQVFLK